MKVKDLVLIAFLTGLLFVQEEALTFLPNIQLTVFLLVLYAKKLGFKKTTLIITIHVLLDNMVFGGFNPIVITFMWIGWMWIPVILCLFFKHINTSMKLACLGVLFALLYSWTFVVCSCFIFNMKFIHYMIADIPFELILALSSFLSILWLYEPVSKVFDRYLV